MDETIEDMRPEQSVAGETLSVSETSKQYSMFFLHGITGDVWVSANSPLMPEHADFQTRLEVCLAFGPQLSTSTLNTNHPDRRVALDTGLIIAEGVITDANIDDSGTRIREDGNRISRGARLRDPSEMIEILSKSDSKSNFSEVVIAHPQFAGLWWKPEKPSTLEGPMPAELIAASRQVGLPIYVIDQTGIHVAENVTDDGKFSIGDVLEPEDISPVQPTIDVEELQQELLEKGVFRLGAIRERQLLSASESGRLAYYGEHPEITDQISESEDPAAIHIAPGGGGPSIGVTIKEEYGEPRIEVTTIGAAGSLKPQKAWYRSLAAIPRNLYVNEPPGIGDSELEKSIAYGYEESTAKAGDLLSIIESFISYSQAALEKLNYSADELAQTRQDNIANYLPELGFWLHGFADEATAHGDTQSASIARTMAESLVDEPYYRAMRERRILTIGKFMLTKDDVSLFLNT